MDKYTSILRSLSRYTDTLGATILTFKNPIKMVVAIYIVMAILPFIAAFTFLMIQAIVHNHPDIDKFIKLGATIILVTTDSFTMTPVNNVVIEGTAYK